jgi:cytochrome c biogenesis protein CcdA
VVDERVTNEPSLGQLFVDLSNDLSHLVRQELALAKAEVTENIDRGRQGVILMAAGGIIAFAGVLVLLAAAVIVVGHLIDSYWLSALIVGAIVTIIGLVVLFSGKGKLDRMNLVPKKTINSLERDAQMAKEKLS